MGTKKEWRGAHKIHGRQIPLIPPEVLSRGIQVDLLIKRILPQVQTVERTKDQREARKVYELPIPGTPLEV